LTLIMYILEVLKTQCPHLCTILWRLLNHVQDVNGSIRRNQLVTENVIHLYQPHFPTDGNEHTNTLTVS
jgi:hypothetical protein